MLNRTRNYNLYEPVNQTFTLGVTSRKIGTGIGVCVGEHQSETLSSVTRDVPVRFAKGTIWDYKTPTSFRRATRTRKILRVPFLVKDCYHSKVAMTAFSGDDGKPAPQQGTLLFEYSKDLSTMECNYEVGKTMNCTPLAFLCWRYGSEYVNSLFASLPQTHPPGTEFAEVNWAALADAFDEKTKSLIPSSFLLGETMYESSIFKTALKFVANPLGTVARLVKDVQKRGLHRMNMGKIAHYYHRSDSPGSHLKSQKEIVSSMNRSLKYLGQRNVSNGLDRVQLSAVSQSSLKELINLHLSYKFGVVPAVHDIMSMLDAHSQVDGRLAYLNKHRGRYVPIRASAKLNASYTPGDFPPTGTIDFGPVLQKCYTKAVIFGMGKVRDDIHEASRWRAYSEYFGLNKVIGLGWELIPFSFVADWFFNAQEVVNSLTRIPLGERPYMNLACIGHSVKNVSTYDYVCNPGYDNTFTQTLTQPDSPFPIFSYAVSDYTRTPGFPNTSLFDTMSNFGLFHGVTLGELLLQKTL